MALAYLSGSDPTLYGVPNATPAQINAASRIVDQITKRPEGLVWTPDAAGAPCFMAGLDPVLRLTLGADIAPGTAVTVPVANAGLMTVGDVLIADRADTNKIEALTVSAITPTTLTFSQVLNAHSSGAALESGMVIEEEVHPTPQGLLRLLRMPVMRPLGGSYRDGFGGTWLADIQSAGRDAVQVSALLPSQNGLYEVGAPGRSRSRLPQVTVRYVAGFPIGAVPSAIKQATANIITAAVGTSDLVGNLKSIRAGDTEMERFSTSNVDTDTYGLLARFSSAIFY